MNIKTVLISLCFLIGFQHAFAAFEISPVIASVAPSGPDASVSLTVTNPGDQKTPIQISIFHRNPDLNGNEKYEDSKDVGELFQIIPSQLILNPKEKRTIRITYVGDPKIKVEQAFRVISEEFPINVTDPEKVKKKAVASISIMSKYVGSLYVKPLGTVPDVSIQSSITKDKKLELIFENKGTEHFLTKDTKYKVTLVSGKKEFPLPLESIQAIGVQNILSGKSRKFTIPWPNGIPREAINIAIDKSTK
jgi:fimbrial chaperone protein